MKIQKALIATAGFGTRFLPITKTIQKEMLPILNRPTIDYVVADCIKAGITDIIFVINEHNSQVKDYYSESSAITERLQATGRTGELDALQKLHTQASFAFIEQKQSGQYGSGVPVKLAEQHLKNEDAFLVFMGDDFLFNPNGESSALHMIDAFTGTNSAGLITCTEMPEDTLHRYGVIETISKDGKHYLQSIVEKPAAGTAPSNLINISKYIFTPDVFPLLEQQQIDSQTNELLITDTLTTLAESGRDILVHEPKGEFLDSGTVGSWLQANLRVAYADPKLRQQIVKAFEELDQPKNA